MMRHLLFGLAAIIEVSLPTAAQEYPSRSITVVIPFPAGGTLDTILRTVQPKMEAALGQSIVVENKPGATGNIGNAYVAKSEPDGCTLLETATNIGVFPHIFPKLNYDPLKDLVIIGGVAETPRVCVVNAEGNIKTFAELLQTAQANPGSVSFGSAGAGASSHLVVELIAQLNHVTFTHVPYKGTAPMNNDLLGGFITFICTAVAGSTSLIQEGRFRPIAMATTGRWPMLPDVPTLKELGFGDINDWTSYVLL
ncbi:MAG: tripartite tricarboxylate transporter substrate binding protein, partial [Pseudorhodoplanes sp.]